MASSVVPRLAVRHAIRPVQRRAASSTASSAASTAASAAAKAKEGAANVAGQAQQGLSKVTSSAGSAVSGAAAAASNAASGIGGRAGSLINFVQSLIPPTIYYARVAGELGRIVIQQRGMAPPTMQTIQSYLTPVQNALRNPASAFSRTTSQAVHATEKTADAVINNPESFLTRLRNLDHATLMTVGVVAAETLGFFTVGEMIGRFKIIGYRGGNAHGEHH